MEEQNEKSIEAGAAPLDSEMAPSVSPEEPLEGNVALSQESDDPWEQSAPPGFMLSRAYMRKIAKIKEELPNCVIVRDMGDVEMALHDYCWGVEQCVAAFPWSRLSFGRTARKDISFFLSTQWVREHFVDVMAGWPNTARNARFLYAPAELAAWFREHLNSTVESVLVPLTLFTDHPDEMRSDFLRAKEVRLLNSYEGGPAAYRENRLSTWGIADSVRLSLRKELGRWFEDVTEKAQQQGVQFHRAKLPTYSVQIPEGMMPKFFTIEEVAATRDYPTKEVGLSTVRSFGWAKHEMLNRKVRCLGYTQGLAIGGKEYDIDYDLGLVELMTAERFVRIFGESALKSARWRISKDLTTWARPDADFGPGLPPKQLSALLGINYVTNIQVFR